jgi:hypothetical protein
LFGAVLFLSLFLVNVLGLSATEAGIVQIPFDRPRALSVKRDPKFLEIEERIWQMVEEAPERIGMTKAAG